MGHSANIALRYIDIFSTADGVQIADIVAPAIRFTINGIELPAGPRTVEQRVTALRAGASDYRFTVQHLLEDGATVAIRYRRRRYTRR